MYQTAMRYPSTPIFDQLFSAINSGSHTHTKTESKWIPAVDLKEREDSYLVSADLPGISPDQISIEVDNGTLLIAGKRKFEDPQDKESYRRVERQFGAFKRSISLPEDAAIDQISAKNEHGVLEIVIPKMEEKRAKKIQITH
jgi:HSP20 family protein